MSDCPTGKHKFHERSDAKRVLKKMKACGVKSRLRVYRCDLCGGEWFHIGSTKGDLTRADHKERAHQKYGGTAA
jgi:hypothetical protein